MRFVRTRVVVSDVLQRRYSGSVVAGAREPNLFIPSPVLLRRGDVSIDYQRRRTRREIVFSVRRL